QDAVEFEDSSYIERSRTRTKQPKGDWDLMARKGDSGTVLLARPGGGGAGTAAAGGGVALSLSGNTAGALGLISSGTAILAGGNNITLSQNGQSITISGANAGGAQTGMSGLSNSEVTYTSGTVSFSELGAITIRSTTGQQFQFSVAPQSAQTFVGGIAANALTTYTS